MTILNTVLAIVIAYVIIKVVEWVVSEATFRFYEGKLSKHDDLSDFWRYVDNCKCKTDDCCCDSD